MLKMKPWLQLGASIVAVSAAAPAFAQDVAPDDEIVVTAQRREQNIQDVPVTVTAVTADQIADLNIFRFEDIESLSPGLQLDVAQGTGSGAQATMRGVTFNTNASGDPAVDFYVNETPVDSNYALQSLYDIQQIEVLRGPQGTLRGRPSPGGAITLATRRPDLDEYGGSISTSFTDQNGVNAQAALNVPIIEDVLAVRVAGVIDESDLNGIRSVNAGVDEHRRTESWRASVRWTPVDAVDATLTHQHLATDSRSFASVQGPGAGYNGPPITTFGVSVQDAPGLVHQKSDITTLNIAWDLQAHRLIYTGAHQENAFESTNDLDGANGVANWPQRQTVDSEFNVDTHELRLESVPNGGFADYVLGVWYQETETRTTFEQPAPLDGAFGSPLSPSPLGPPNPDFVIVASGLIPTEATNYAVYGNTAFHLSERTDLSIGLRWLRNESSRSETINTSAALIPIGILPGVDVDSFITPGFFGPGSPPGCAGIEFVAHAGFTGGETYDGYCDLGLAAGTITTPSNRTDEEWVYTGSLTHHFTDDLMGYFTYGHSWRPPGVTVAITSPVTRDLIEGDPEESDSYELGIRSEWLDGHLRANASVYHQDFTNFIGRFENIPYVGPGPSVQSGGFTYAADAVADGAEIDLVYDVTEDWWVQLSAAAQDAHFDNARVPCRDTNFDGVPDDGDSGLLAPADFGSDSVFYCVVDDPLSTAPEWNATLQSEYSFPMFGAEGYVRGLYAYQPENANVSADFTREAFGVLNLYAGVRGTETAWELSVWAKNVLDEEVELNQGQIGTAFGLFNTGYYSSSRNLPREIGVTMRYAFGGGCSPARQT